MLIGEAIQRVQSLYSRGVQSQNTRLSFRHIYNKLRTVRSRVITQEYNKKQIINQWSYQTLPCIEMIEIPLNECPCQVQSNCTILRSKYPIPSFMTGLDRMMVQSVSDTEGNLSFSPTSFINKKYYKGARYTQEDPDWFIANIADKSYLYITFTTKIGPLRVTALYDDPIKAYRFPSFCGNNPFDCVANFDLEFPIDNDLMDAVIELSSKELIEQFTQQRQDITDNAVDDTASTNGQDQGR